MFTTADAVLQYVTAGNATVTVTSAKTGKHFTFRCRKPDPREGDRREPPVFVSTLVGPDNTADYKYFGLLRDGEFRHGGAKAKIADAAPSVKAWAWVWAWLRAGALPADCAIAHNGTCGRCGRVLTTPESIDAGFGPECLRRIS